MKIFQVISHSDLGGAQTVLVNLANSLVKRNHEVIVISGPNNGKMFPLLDKNIIIEIVNSLQRDISVYRDICSIWNLHFLYMKYKPDIIHLHTAKTGVIGRLAFPSHKIIYTVHGFDAIRIAHRRFLLLERILQYKCRFLVGVSLHDLNGMKENGIHHNVRCIYNGINKPHENIEFDFSKYKKYERVIMCIARLAPPKDEKLFIQIAQLLPHYAFVWIGNLSPIDDRNLPHNVFFEGNIANAAVLCKNIDLFILTSGYEGLPVSIIEAMSFGKPIVASNVGGISEIVLNGKNGFVLENNARMFADKIKYILNDSLVYEKYSTCSTLLYEQQLTVEHMVNSYLKLYNEIL